MLRFYTLLMIAVTGGGSAFAQQAVVPSTAAAPAVAVVSTAPAVVTASTAAPAAAPAAPAAGDLPFPHRPHRSVLFLDDISQNMSFFNSFFTGLDKNISGNGLPGRNTTVMSLRLKATSAKYEKFRLNPLMDLRVDMPKTLRRLKLVVNHAPEDDNTIRGEEERIAQGQAAGEGTTIGADIKFVINRFLEENVHIGSQLRVGNRRPFIIFAKARLNAEAELSPAWKAKTFAQAAWYSKSWLNLSCGLYFSRALPRHASLSFNSSLETPTNIGKIDLFETVALTKRLSRTDSLGLATQMHSVTVPVNRVEAYTVYLAYRRNLYNAWFYGEISPGVTYARTHSFKAAPGVSLKFSMRFGSREKPKAGAGN